MFRTTYTRVGVIVFIVAMVALGIDWLFALPYYGSMLSVSRIGVQVAFWLFIAMSLSKRR